MKKSLLILLLISSFTGCTDLKIRESNQLFAQGKYVESVKQLETAVNDDPKNASLRAAYLSKRADTTQKILILAEERYAQGKLDEVNTIVKQILEYDKSNELALNFLAKVEQESRHQSMLNQAKSAIQQEQTEHAQKLLADVLKENPKNTTAQSLRSQIERQQRQQQEQQSLHLAETRPVTLEFRDANIKMIFEVMSKHTGINFILDKDVQGDARTTIFLRNTPIESALDLLASTNQLNKKILNDKTVLIYPDTQKKRDEYQDLMVRSFFLENADAKTLGPKIKTMFKLRDMLIDEKLNVLILRDTPQAIQIAERMINLLDRSEPEVVLEVEVLEINRSRLYELGVNFPSKFSFSPLPPSGNAMTLDFLKNINSSQIGIGFTNPTLNLRREVGDVNTLANPRIRVKNKEKAKIMIGERLPVVSTTTSGTTGYISESIQYTEVGIKLEAEPQISLNNEVSMNILLEVSSVSNQVKTNSGSIAYQIGTRNATTVLKLHDGETQILAGLLSNTERSSANRIPGFGDIPIIGRFFGSTLDDAQKTEVLLSITPRLVRNVQRPTLTEGEFWSGTESNLSLKPLLLPVQNREKPKASDWKEAPATSQNTAQKTPVEEVPSGVTDQAPTKIVLNWQGEPSAPINTTQTLTLRINTDGAIRGLPLKIGFNPAQIQVLEVLEGNFFKQENGNSSFSFQIADDKILTATTRNGSNGVAGNDTLITIRYRLLDATGGQFNVLQATALGEGTMPNVEPPVPFKISPK